MDIKDGRMANLLFSIPKIAIHTQVQWRQGIRIKILQSMGGRDWFRCQIKDPETISK